MKAQLLNYLRATQYEVGLLLNFGPKPEFVRKAFDNANKASLTWERDRTRTTRMTQTRGQNQRRIEAIRVVRVVCVVRVPCLLRCKAHDMQPIKLLHTADIHIGMENYGRIDPATGINARVMDFLRRLSDIGDYAIEQGVDVFVFAGDAYKTRDPNPPTSASSPGASRRSRTPASR